MFKQSYRGSISDDQKGLEQEEGPRNMLLPDDDILTETEIKTLMDQAGYPEMERLWQKFKQLSKPLARIEEKQLAVMRQNHMGGFIAYPWLMVGFSGVFGGLGLWYFFVVLLPATGPLPLLPLTLMALLHAFNTTFLLGYIILLVQRYFIHPMQTIMALDLAWMLGKRDFRDWFDQQASTQVVMERLRSYGINEWWDNPGYSATYQPVAGGYQKREREPFNESLWLADISKDL